MSGTVLRVQGIPAHFSLFLRYFFREVPRNNRIEVCGSFSGGERSPDGKENCRRCVQQCGCIEDNFSFLAEVVIQDKIFGFTMD